MRSPIRLHGKQRNYMSGPCGHSIRLTGRALRRARQGVTQVLSRSWPSPKCGSDAKPHKMVWVSAYHMQRLYGGPEEGGWWFDAADLLETVHIRRDKADAVVARMREQYAHYDDERPIYSVASGGKLFIEISYNAGFSWPTGTPHYE